MQDIPNVEAWFCAVQNLKDKVRLLYAPGIWGDSGAWALILPVKEALEKVELLEAEKRSQG